MKKIGLDESTPEIYLEIENLREKLINSDKSLSKIDLLKEIYEFTTYLLRVKKFEIKKSEVLSIMARHEKYFSCFFKEKKKIKKIIFEE